MRKLQSGDNVAVIAPAESLKKKSEIFKLAEDLFATQWGTKIIYGKNVAKKDMLGSTSAELRAADLHDAFKNDDVKAVICAKGGYNSNELLKDIDWSVIKANPKPIIGSSDMTVLLNAIHAKTGLITYFGPNFFKFGMKHGFEYSLEYFKKCLFSEEPFLVAPSKKWSNDRWSSNQEDRTFYKNKGPVVISDGAAKGTIIGGNLCSLNLLQGTEYMPSLKNSILFIEEDDFAGESCFGEFGRNLTSLLQLPDAKHIKGIVVGRFQPKTEMTTKKLRFIFDKVVEDLGDIPIVVNVDFGHSEPSITFPIGGKVEVEAHDKKVQIKVLSH